MIAPPRARTSCLGPNVLPQVRCQLGGWSPAVVHTESVGRLRSGRLLAAAPTSRLHRVLGLNCLYGQARWLGRLWSQLLCATESVAVWVAESIVMVAQLSPHRASGSTVQLQVRGTSLGG
jgi:hypothetical protein